MDVDDLLGRTGLPAAPVDTDAALARTTLRAGPGAAAARSSSGSAQCSSSPLPWAVPSAWPGGTGGTP